jgi:NADH-quinone oxidoreductase subunit K
MTISMEHGLMVAGVLFALGLVGLLVRRNVVFMLMSVEIMLNAAGLAFIVAGARWGSPDGQVMFLFILTMAAAEVAVGLALVLQVYAKFKTVDTDAVNSLASTPLPTASPSATPMAQDPATRGGI